MNILEKILKTGCIHNGVFEYQKVLSGTLQAGIISPTLTNMTLNGIEKVVIQSIKSITTSKAIRYTVRDKKGQLKWYSLFIKCIRFANDFVILARSKHVIQDLIKPQVTKFLLQRGLSLSEEKTKMFCIKDQQLDYLGFTFKYRNHWKIKYGMIKAHLGEKEGIALYPSKASLFKIMSKLKNIFKNSTNDSSYTLIAKLNPIIRG